MRLSKPRLDPLPETEWSEEQRELIQAAERGGPSALNIYRTLAHHTKLLKRWGVFGAHVLYKNSLPARERELIILRTGWLCQSEYEWGQHVLISRAAGIPDEEIARVKNGPDAPGWSDIDAALLRAADELHTDSMISDDTWRALSSRFNKEQLIDLVFTVGQYHIVSMALNTLGVQLDEGVPGFNS
jgi:4-carboxymuconolactone decarboxylase